MRKLDANRMQCSAGMMHWIQYDTHSVCMLVLQLQLLHLIVVFVSTGVHLNPIIELG